MGPDNSNLSSRPQFFWDIRSTPWTDGKGSQDGYAPAVKLREQLHDKLPENNSNRISRDFRGIGLKSQLSGRAIDLTKGIPDEIIALDGGVEAIVNAVYKRDALPVANEVYCDFSELLQLKRGANESLRNYEARFPAQTAKLHAHGETLSLHESLLAPVLLSGSSIDDSQRIPILSAAGGHRAVDASKSSGAIVSTIKYEAVAFFIRQCESKHPRDTNSSGNANIANTSSFGRRSGSQSAGRSTPGPSLPFGKSGKPRMTPEQLRSYKLRFVCRTCHMRGHWESDHARDGSVKDRLSSLPLMASSSTALASHPREILIMKI